MAMLIVDSHVHLWATGTPSPAHRQVPVLSDDTLLREMGAAGGNAAVVQPPAWDATSNEVAVEAARRHPRRFAVLGWFPLDRPESRALIDGWTGRPGMLGLRFTFMPPNKESWLTDGTLDWLWPAAERAGLPVALAAGNFLALVGRIAERHPGLRLLVDHLGMPLRTRDAAALVNLPQLVALAKHPNIAVKASAAAGASSEPYPFRNIHGYLHAVYDACGPERMFWGTDITRMPCTWRQCVTLFTEELPWLSAADKEQIMGRALCRWIGWDIGG
jgi:predicted TIM-barrel fold metal-dependent hydrolase